MSGGATLSKKQPRPILGPANTAQPFTLGNSSTTITSALESYAGNNSSAAKSMPSVTLTPTGNMGTKKRMNIKNTPLRPIEAQSVVNIAGKIFLQFFRETKSVKYWCINLAIFFVKQNRSNVNVKSDFFRGTKSANVDVIIWRIFSWN